MIKKKHGNAKKVLSASLALALMSAPFLSTPASAEYAHNHQTGKNHHIEDHNDDDRDRSHKASVLKLRVMETTDIHTNLLAYDYYKDAAYEKVGLAKTARLVKQARQEVKNSLLVDNGDLIQGTPLGTYKAKIDPLENREVHPVFKAMNQMDYDMATLGNHEFNYGLEFLDEAYDDANFPFVNANVYKDDHDNNPNNDKNKFTPYKIVKKKVVDEHGKKHVIKVGYIGFVPPQINEWDKAHLDGKVITKDIVETARKFIPKMKKDGADVVIAMTHSGFSANKGNTEDVIYSLSEVPGINAITFSHTHKVFPAKTEAALDGLFLGPDKKPLPGVDNAKGTINGVPAVQAGYGGGSLGIIDLELKKEKGEWSVVNSQSSTRETYKDVKDPATGKTVTESTVSPDQAIVRAVKDAHDATVKYVNTPIGKTTDDIHSYFSLVQDDPSIQVVTNAQKWFVEKYVAEKKPEYKDLPILSVGAPFKAGRNGVAEYTEIKKGDLTIRSAGDLYLYDNTLKAIKVKGSVVKEWIEMSAGKFNQIDPKKTEEQALLNPAFQVFNFDVIDGVQYQIDVTKAAKYDPNGKVINPDSSRVSNLMYNGQPVDPNQDFIVVTNNYRAGGGGNFPGVKGSELVVDSADENRQILMDYIAEMKEITPTADDNWSIAPIEGNVNVTFTTSPKAEAYIKEGSKISNTNKTDSLGFGIFKLDIGVAPKENTKVQLLGLNDLHGQLDTDTKVGNQFAGSMEYTAAAIRQREVTNPNSLLVHSGDMIGGSPLISALFQDEPTVEVMEAMGFDVGTLGNHEFDEGIAELRRMMNGGDHPKGSPGYDGMNFPVVAANAFDMSTGDLITKPYAIEDVGGQKLGFIGVVTQETPNMIVTKGNEDLKITDEAEAINKYTHELKQQGIEAIVVLAHNPATQDGYTDAFDASQIAEKVDDEVDVIFAAHNHVNVNRVVDNKLIVQAYSYGSAFSDVDLELDPVSGEIVKKAAEIVTVYQNDYTPDPAVSAIMKKYEDKVAPIKAEVVGQSATTLAKNYPSTASEFADVALGNLIADGMKKAMNSDFALMNGGGVRAQLDAGEVTFGDLFSIQPFGNILNKVKLSGADLETVLNNQITMNPTTKALSLDFHVAGFKYTYDSGTGKVVDIIMPDGSKIDKTKEYTVVVNNYMYGNTKYGIGALSTDLEVGPEDLQATVDFVKSLPQPFEYKAEGRIQKLAPVVATP
ncbi:bifunctional 2',3'-cyclic-nucleotide 2'-phosphodiesterase/3'-nucleotidase [Bacillus canaveralius]|uniref:Bifunctional 2',3'-cyclic-nucleotide 2'-phosphodiesterase/3'-nucleotidase n=1 Tax=Bacillus canaveralius TaxID=1403243 RepID=A0A2N5GH75_9BACI|nr:bifunctional 2',3'-cyclic-nucleotide 2'-phosphodiesterase/3'-nucleotidase [Bacillus canaveralius]PLR80113.1 bifunctional 2',3'-cyclic-nucleotide 2'-phosphodiesterase/3'-nucleotidase [Bacillus canaveralius]PLR91637.1 bifunctional 2',3'-cyclic-nucleotide 2'-phosphodiesterase/3'-nucleotidase [Bacillus canaveralius]